MPLAPSDVVPVESWVIFSPGAEGLRAVLGNDLSPSLADELKRHGLDFSKPLQAALRLPPKPETPPAEPLHKNTIDPEETPPAINAPWA